MPKKIMLIIGARPNFIKAAPLMRELSAHTEKFDPFLIHTGQHYDHNLSQLFFEQLKMPQPDIYLGVGSGSHARQTAKIMTGLEEEFEKNRPDLVIVFGDVNSTLAASIVTSKMCLKLAHVEAGLRSFDNTMPEEINRIVTDRLSDFLFITEKSGSENLHKEGVSEDKVFFVGNIMIDSLVKNLELARESKIIEQLGIKAKEYAVLTLHRPANVDNKDRLDILLKAIGEVSQKLPVIFPCHPRTKNALSKFGFNFESNDNFKIIDPVGYLDFLNLQANARLVLTDSGGIQEETTYLQIPCITIRENTERPITAEVGTNVLAGLEYDKIIKAANNVFNGKHPKGRIPDLWDGHTAQRIIKTLEEIYDKF
ncbi:MAG: UDP-N-acetylglucosamine 2-epimerase (non-hydrolyzing) [candidate division Zixibacteria bacterium]